MNFREKNTNKGYIILLFLTSLNASFEHTINN